MLKFFENILHKKAPAAQDNVKQDKPAYLAKSVKENVTQLKQYMNNSFDIIVREVKIGQSEKNAAVVFIGDLVKEDIVLEHIIKPLTRGFTEKKNDDYVKISLAAVKDNLISTGRLDEVDTFDKAVLAILSGETLIIINDCSKALVAGTKSFPGINISLATREPSVKGSKEAIVENLIDNIGLVRKRLKDPNLTFELFKVGRRSKSDVVIIYIKGVVNDNVVNEVRNRISALDVDDGISSNQISQLINDRPNSIFPLIQTTERPDKVVSAILEGRVGILMDGTPNALVVPVTLPILMQSVDDYYEQWFIGSVIRLGRYVALFSSALLPSLYIAITSFHPGILPTNIMLSIAGTRVGVPFPAIFEAFLMIAVLELMHEAGIRLPKTVGQTVSIVGGLVIGQSAVQAGIVSPIMLIIISTTAISGYAIPDYSLGLTTRLMRVPFIILASIIGTLGTSLGLLYFLGYVASLESFGVGYLEPITPYRARDWKDTLIRAPQSLFGKRPEFLNPEDTQRQRVRKRGDGNEKR